MSLKDKNLISELVEKCCQGDRRAWDRLIDRITPLIFSICREMGLSHEESLDIFGQVSFLLLKNLDKLKSAEKLLAYVGTMTRREIYTLVRRAKLFRRLEDYMLETADNPATEKPGASPDREIGSEQLWKAMMLLPERDFKLLYAIFFDAGKPSYKDISRMLGMPVSSIGPSRARSIRKLYKILKKVT